MQPATNATCSGAASTCATATSFSPAMASGGGRKLFFCNGEHPQKPTPIQIQPANSLGEILQSLFAGQEVQAPGCDPTAHGYHPSDGLGNVPVCMPLAQPLLRKA